MLRECQIAITTNEISQDPVTAIELGCLWGISNYELKVIMGARVPRVPDNWLKAIENAMDAYAVNISCISPGLFIDTVWGSTQAEDHSRSLFPESVEFAQRFGTDKIIVFAYRRPDGTLPEERCPEPVIEELRRKSEIAQREGITLVLENMVTTWADTSTHTADVLDRVDHPAFRANWDPGNIVTAGDHKPYPEGYELVAQRVGHTHIKDALPNPEKSRGYEITTLMGGLVDWKGQLKALRDDGFDGYLTIETHFAPFVRNSKADLDQLRQMLRELQQ